jgi:ABC transport system ATP-binding/permease protein
MKKEILESLIHLFSIISMYYKGLSEEEALNFIEVFLETEYHLENISDYSSRIKSNLQYYRTIENNDEEKLSDLCQNIKGSLPKKTRVLILIHVMQFLKFTGNVQSSLFAENKEQAAAKLIAREFKIDENEFTNFAAFISNMLHKVKDKEQLLIISKPIPIPGKIRFIERKELNGKITFLYIKSVYLYLFYYEGEQELYLNNKPLFTSYLYLFSHNSVISGDNFPPIYYNEILAGFSDSQNKFAKITLEAREIDFKFENSNNGIHQFSLCAKSFQFIGVMGSSGTGKSTLLNILNGNIEPRQGEIFINGLDFSEHKRKFKGIIGYVPQDDSLKEELTVFDNLYYVAKFCYKNLSNEQINDKVNNLLTELDLFEVKNLKVGSILKKLISGGQRKRLNIALELIREPLILLVDEPTSGLSSSDAEKIVYLLADQVNKGCLVIANIHQPSSEIFKLFDNLIILDKGGYTVYLGPPSQVFDYFRQKTGRIDMFKGFTKQGYFVPEEIFRLIEEKKLNEYGEFTSERVHTPEEWHAEYINGQKKEIKDPQLLDFPIHDFEPPGKLNQALIYFIRNLKAKLADKQYLLVALLIAPALAILLAYFTKNTRVGDDGLISYSFSSNDNMPSFFFMSVIVSLFIGLVVSAEEIIGDRKLMMRESFLNLSRGAYLHSKIFTLMIIGFVQTSLYVFFSIVILGIPDMNLKFFCMMFSLSCLANIIGLVISDSMSSIISVYIIIPIILIPQLLLGGAVVNFEDLHYSISSQKYTPVVGDMMPSRWGFEALMVEQYKNNDYEKLFYKIEKKISDYNFIQYNIVPCVTNNLNDCKIKFDKNKAELIKDGFRLIELKANIKMPHFSNQADTQKIVNSLKFMEKCKDFLTDELNKLMQERDELVRKMIGKFPSKELFMEFKNSHVNEGIERLVKHEETYSRPMSIYQNQIIRKSEPVFNMPDNRYGRSHFYAPIKKIGGLNVDTFWFNTMILWMMWFSVYVYLLFNLKNIIKRIFKKL